MDLLPISFSRIKSLENIVERVIITASDNAFQAEQLFYAKNMAYVASAAERLQMPKRTLYRKIKKYNLNLEEYRKW